MQQVNSLLFNPITFVPNIQASFLLRQTNLILAKQIKEQLLKLRFKLFFFG